MVAKERHNNITWKEMRAIKKLNKKLVELKVECTKFIDACLDIKEMPVRGIQLINQANRLNCEASELLMGSFFPFS